MATDKAHFARVVTIFVSHKCLTLIFLSLFACFAPSYGTETDVYCLKSFKDSIEDPFGYLTSSWDFNNYTEGFICKFIGVECWHPDENKVLNLKLSDMGLRGQFPLGLANCTGLTGLNLSSNHFYGPIPSDISTMLPFVTYLDLSSNKFSGKIPSGIANISYLNVLKLDNNQLRGEIPAQFAHSLRIKAFSVANNHLSGKVPVFANSFVSAESFANNKGLCGHPLDPCKDGLVSLLKRKFGIFFMSGFAVGYAAAFLFVIVAFMLVCMPKKPAKMVTMRRRSNRKKKKEAADQERRESLLPTNIISRSNNIKISNLEKFVTRMNLAEIKKATDNFSQDGVIGVGKTGTMHKATLPNGWFLAIKKLHYNQHFEDHFVSEIMVLGRLRHRNLTTLLGFCIENNERLLVYTYMPNGNLRERLNPGPVIGESSEILSLDWPLRVKIALGIARGLAWLHNNNFQVFHLSLSSKCIQLDQNFEPKISNFADSKFINNKATDLSSSSLYQSGEFSKSGFANKDVHDFGMILVEMITSNKAIAINPCNLLDDQISSSFYDAIDESLVGKGYDGEIYELLRIALNCVEPSLDMIEVYKAIRSIGQSYELKDDSETWIPS